MMTKINEGGVVDDTGFEIQIKGPGLLEYEEQGAVLRVSLDFDPTTTEIGVYASEIERWWNRPQLSKLTDAEKARIAQNIKDALALLNGNFVMR